MAALLLLTVFVQVPSRFGPPPAGRLSCGHLGISGASGEDASECLGGLEGPGSAAQEGACQESSVSRETVRWLVTTLGRCCKRRHEDVAL